MALPRVKLKPASLACLELEEAPALQTALAVDVRRIVADIGELWVFLLSYRIQIMWGKFSYSTTECL